MRCQKCGAEWTLSANSSIIMTACPFCGASLIKEEAENPLENTLHTIYQQIGEAGMRNGNRLIGYFMDFAPSLKKEVKMLSLFIKCNGHAALLDSKNNDIGTVRLTAERIIFQMTEELMAEEHCRMICEAFCRAVGVQVTLKKPNASGRPDVSAGKTAPQAGTSVRESESTRSREPAAGTPGRNTGSSASSSRNANKSTGSAGSQTDVYPTEFVVKDGSLRKYTGFSADVVVPNGIQIIRNAAFRDNKAIRRVVLPESVRRIGVEAFAWSSIESIELSKELTEIADQAFQRTKLKSIIFPDKVKKIGMWSFKDTQIEEVTIPGKVRVIPYGAFEHCENLRTVRLENGVEKLDRHAFDGCQKLETVYLPDTLTEVVISTSQGSFKNCPALRCIHASSAWKNAHPELYHALVALQNQPSEISTPAASDPSLPFQAKTSSKAKTDNNEEHITSQNKTVNQKYPASKAPNISPSSNDLNRIKPSEFEVVDGVLTKYRGTEGKAVIPEGVRAIGAHAFENCADLREIVFPASITEIGDYAFSNCVNLSPVFSLPESIKTLGKGTFSGSGIKILRLPDGLDTIPERLCENCTKLAAVILPERIAHINEYAFSGCHNNPTVNTPLTLLDRRQVEIKKGNECLERGALKSIKPSDVFDILSMRIASYFLTPLSPYPFLCACDNGFQEKYQKVRKAYVDKLSEKEQPFLIYDTTLFGNGKKGFTITTHRIFFQGDYGKGSLSISDAWSFFPNGDKFYLISFDDQVELELHFAGRANNASDASTVATNLSEALKWLERFREITES